LWSEQRCKEATFLEDVCNQKKKKEEWSNERPCVLKRPGEVTQLVVDIVSVTLGNVVHNPHMDITYTYGGNH
jgi:hypothetical protein